MMTRLLVTTILLTSCRFDLPTAVAIDAEIDSPVDSPVAVDGSIDADPMPWLRPWTHRKQITLLASRIEAPGDGSLTDFPVLVSVTDAQLAATALATGADIVFAAADAKTMLASEIESYTPATGQLVAWVKVPSLSATTDTKLYIYYGHQNPPTRQPQNVWTANYLAVWHLHQDPGPGNSGEIKDATSAGHHGTAADPFDSSDSVPARIGQGIRFDGAQEYLSFGAMDFGNTFTISMWVSFAGGADVKTLLANSPSGLTTNGFRFSINTAATSDRRFLFDAGDGTRGRAITLGSSTFQNNTPIHLAVVANRTTGLAGIYFNGTTFVSDSTFPSFETNSDFNIGQAENGIYRFPGTLDEVQVAGTMRSAEWLLTSVRNQSQPGSFHTLGAEERL